MGRKKEFDIDDVLEKAMNVFWVNGYDGTSVRMLEKSMGINQFSIYNTFGSKHGLFLEVIKTYEKFIKANIFKGLIESKGHIKDIRDTLLTFGLALQTGEILNSCLIVNTSVETTDTSSDIYNDLNTFYDFVKNALFNVLEQSKINKELPPDFDSEIHAFYLLGCFQSITVFAKHRSEEEIINYVNVIMKSIR